MAKNTNNDELIMELQKKIEEKELLLKQTEKFVPVTNASLVLLGERYNLHVIDKEESVRLLVILKTFNDTAEGLSLSGELVYSGFPASEWITDLTNRIAYLSRRQEQDKLKAMRLRLKELLSKEKKTELELAEIMSALN